MRKALSRALLYGFPIDFQVDRGKVRIAYKGRAARYVILELRDPLGNVTGVGLAVAGLENFHVKIAEVGEGEPRILWEELPRAIGLDKNFMGWGETDLWTIRFRLREKLRRAANPPAILSQLERLGLAVLTTPEELEYAVGTEEAIALWFTPTFQRIDFAMELQEKLGLVRWGELTEGVKEWARRLGLSA
ncbi:MAG: hypothetical protein NZ902_05710 [Acidilobaceae archaeon]|nr:hypothetical protein [Acidilobaceae archaeon]MDW7974704.1 hypothetical protein [Sulfolobales archaeon]